MDNIKKCQHGNWLPYSNDQEMEEAKNWLEKWADCYCFRFLCEEDEEDKKIFSYIPVDVKFMACPPIMNHPREKGAIAIVFKIEKRHE